MQSVESVSILPEADLAFLEKYTLVSSVPSHDNIVEDVYERNGISFRLVVSIENEKRQGNAKVFNSANQLVSSIMYVNNQLYGPCKVWNNSGKLVFDGCLENGKKHGICKEWDNHGKVLFHGMYNNGCKMRRYELIPKGSFSGYYMETDMDNKLLSISQFNHKSLKKNGRSIEFMSGNVASEKWFEDGSIVYERCCIERNVMIERDEAEVIVYKGGYAILQNGTLLRHYDGIEYQSDGIIQYQGGFQYGFYHGHGCLYYPNSTVRSFEGEWQYGYPEGSGILYDENGSIQLEGIWHLGYLKNTDYSHGRRRNSCSAVFNTRWLQTTYRKQNKRAILCPGLSFAVIHHVRELTLSSHFMNGCCDDQTLMKLDFSVLSQLRRLDMGSNSFQQINHILFANLLHLESITIGKDCCNAFTEDGCFEITNCPKLFELEVGDGSCCHFHSFLLSRVNSLEFMDIGKECFQNSDSVLKDMPALEMLIYGERSFCNCHNVIFENLPKFRRLIFYGPSVFQGDDQATDEIVINDYPTYTNTFVMRDLPSLSSIENHNDCEYICSNIGKVVLKNIPNLLEDNIDFGDSSFFSVLELRASNAPALQEYIEIEPKFVRIETPF